MAFKWGAEVYPSLKKPTDGPMQRYIHLGTLHQMRHAIAPGSVPMDIICWLDSCDLSVTLQNGKTQNDLAEWRENRLISTSL